MLYSITLTYLHNQDELAHHTVGHKKWLADNIVAGHIIFAGPRVDETGGYILANYPDDDAVKTALADDPFVRYNLVSVEADAIIAAIGAEPFARHWATEAVSLSVK